MTQNSAPKYLVLPIWILALLAFGALMNSAMQIFLWLISSFLLLALLDPWFIEFRKRKVPASVASAVLILGAVAVGFLLISLLAYFSAGIIGDLEESKRTLIQYYESLSGGFKELIKSFSHAIADTSPNKPSLGPKIQKVEVISGSPLGGEMGATLMHGLGSAVVILTYTLLVPILTFFLMMGRNSFSKVLAMAFQEPERGRQMWTKIVLAIRAFFIGNFILAAGTFPLFVVLFYSFNVKSPVTMAVLSSFFNLVPFLGAVLAGFLPALEMLSQHQSPAATIFLFTSCVLVHFIVANFLTPKVLGSKVDVNAAVSAISIIFWGEMWGAIGILLAIPLTATLKIVLENSGYPWLHWVAALMSENVNHFSEIDCGHQRKKVDADPI
jgi:predicted PurR-regulated permease PerM